MLRPYLVDTHCHLGDTAFDADRDVVLAHAKALGVTHVVVIGESVAGGEQAGARSPRGGGLSAAAGGHPHPTRSPVDDARRPGPPPPPAPRGLARGGAR